MPARIFRFLACFLMLALLGVAPALAQVAPRITIESVPPGAIVYVDGAVQGQTGPNFKVRINKGQHRLRLELEGHKPIEQVVTITAAQKFAFNLEKAPGRLDVKFPSTNDLARGAEIYVDGQMAGQVPLMIDVPAGRHLVEIKKPGTKVYTENVELKAGETKPIWVQMQAEARNGTLIVAADAPDADVFVDGQPRGKAPSMVDLNEGEHVVEVRRNEAGAPTWRQTVRVSANQQVKVQAQTLPPPPAPGSLIVLSSVNDAEVTIDGTTKGKIGQPISLPAGQHSISVGSKGYSAVTRVIIIEAGKPLIEKVDLVGSAESRGVGNVRIIMLTPMPGAQYYVNGRLYDESAALSDQGVEIAAGHVVIAVQKDGFGQVKREVNLRPGTTEVIEVELRNVGKLFIASQPPGALVLLDRNLIGQTPLTRENVPAGEHMVEIQKDKHEPVAQKVMLRAGEQENVSVILHPLAPPPIDKLALQKNLSSFSAVTIPLGHFTADVGVGYAYFANARMNVGVFKKNNIPGIRELGIDVGAELRTTFYHFEVGGSIRFQAMRIDPFAIGLRTYVGGGGGPRNRNSVQWELGLPITVLAGSMVKLTAEAYLQVYSDQNCPNVGDIRNIYNRDGSAGVEALGDYLKAAEHTGDRCVGRVGTDGVPPGGTTPNNPIYDAIGYTPGQMMLSAPRYDRNNPAYQVGGTGVLERFNGTRGMLRAIVELALSPNMNVWLMVEGAPLQGDRQMFTDKFNRIFPVNEIPIYGRAGVSLKF
ncbi:MAG TPA: PEGA domain-containing protein [Pseudomonadota bacterium]|nr:PEGA domain-containing protein [Pseudomonadota bacterium]